MTEPVQPVTTFDPLNGGKVIQIPKWAWNYQHPEERLK